jgi:hypothetical protein
MSALLRIFLLSLAFLPLAAAQPESASDVVQAVRPASQPAPPASDARKSRYGVGLGNVRPAQMQTLGLQWFVSSEALTWALQGAASGVTIPDGVQFPFMVWAKSANTETERQTLRMAAEKFPGKYWLIHNEPNVKEMGNMTPTEYAEALHWYAGVLKDIDPAAKLVGPNVLNWDHTCDGCGGFAQGRDWTEQMRAAYLDRYKEEPPLDAWSLHTYDLDWQHLPQGDAQRQIDQMRGMRAWLDSIPALAGKPIWNTEIGLHWGYPGLNFRDDTKLAYPIGDFDYAHVERYMRTVFGWLNENAEALNIERWFLWTAWMAPEAWQEVWGGITLVDGPAADAAITRLGRLYQELAGVR